MNPEFTFFDDSFHCGYEGSQKEQDKGDK